MVHGQAEWNLQDHQLFCFPLDETIEKPFSSCKLMVNNPVTVTGFTIKILTHIITLTSLGAKSAGDHPKHGHGCDTPLGLHLYHH